MFWHACVIKNRLRKNHIALWLDTVWATHVRAALRVARQDRPVRVDHLKIVTIHSQNRSVVQERMNDRRGSEAVVRPHAWALADLAGLLRALFHVLSRKRRAPITVRISATITVGSLKPIHDGLLVNALWRAIPRKLSRSGGIATTHVSNCPKASNVGKISVITSLRSSRTMRD